MNAAQNVATVDIRGPGIGAQVNNERHQTQTFRVDEQNDFSWP